MYCSSEWYWKVWLCPTLDRMKSCFRVGMVGMGIHDNMYCVLFVEWYWKVWLCPTLDRMKSCFRVGMVGRGIHDNKYCVLFVEWYWKVWLCPTLLRILAVLLLLLTAALIWSEVTFFTDKPNLSLFALLIETASKDYLYFYTEVRNDNILIFYESNSKRA